MIQVGPAHPDEDSRMKLLLAYVSEDIPPAVVDALRAAAQRLERAPCTVGSPEVVDELDDTAITRPEDEVVRTVGLALPVSEPNESPGTTRNEIRRFIEEVVILSETGIEFEVQLGDVHVGGIAEGRPDKGVVEGLLMTW